jgi:hypothetical protein
VDLSPPILKKGTIPDLFLSQSRFIFHHIEIWLQEKRVRQVQSPWCILRVRPPSCCMPQSISLLSKNSYEHWEIPRNGGRPVFSYKRDEPPTHFQSYRFFPSPSTHRNTQLLPSATLYLTFLFDNIVLFFQMSGVFINTYIGEPQPQVVSGLLTCKLMLISSGMPKQELTNSLRKRLSFGRRTFSLRPPTNNEELQMFDAQLLRGVELLDEVLEYRWMARRDEALIKDYMEILQLCCWYRRIPLDDSRKRRYASIQWTI